MLCNLSLAQAITKACTSAVAFLRKVSTTHNKFRVHISIAFKMLRLFQFVAAACLFKPLMK